MMLSMQWVLKSQKIPQSQSELLEILLVNRRLLKKKEKDEFLSPRSPLHFTPKDVGIDEKQLAHAVSLIQEAKQKKWKVIVFGDYDCDGICATTVLWETLYEMGIHAMPFIPSRDRHGYGLSMAAIDDILADPSQKPQLLITVDNGIVAHEPFARLKKEGIRTILTDHHQPEKKLPPVDALVHTTQLCGTTVAWMLVHALNPKKAAEMLDLCAIATIADQVPLLNANRSFAKFGIQALQKTQRLGLKMLMQISGLQQDKLDTHAINYGIVPRINAMGRIGDPKDALRLLCSKKLEKIQPLVSAIQGINMTRQDMTMKMVEHARTQQSTWINEHIIIVDSEEYHEGVIGLIAGKLAEEFAKPAIAISRGKMTAKGSARSLPGINITELLRQIRDDLLDVGGHPMAAGFSLLTEKIEIVRTRLMKLAKEQIKKNLLVKSFNVDCELPWELVTLNTAELLEQFEPHGMENPQPAFLLKNMKIVAARAMGKENAHLKLTLQPADRRETIPLQAIAFGKGEKSEEFILGKIVNILCTLQQNWWNGKVELQGIVKAFMDAFDEKIA